MTFTKKLIVIVLNIAIPFLYYIHVIATTAKMKSDGNLVNFRLTFYGLFSVGIAVVFYFNFLVK